MRSFPLITKRREDRGGRSRARLSACSTPDVLYDTQRHSHPAAVGLRGTMAHYIMEYGRAIYQGSVAAMLRTTPGVAKEALSFRTYTHTHTQVRDLWGLHHTEFLM